MSLHDALDTRDGSGLAKPDYVTGNRLAPFPPTGCGIRWHCAWTHQQRERIAASAIQAQGFEAYLPLYLQLRQWSRHEIVPLFPRYLMVRFDPDRDDWGRIRAARGVAGIIRHAADKPTPLPDHAILELLARTSTRGIVDDPGESPWEPPEGRKPLWQGLAALDAGGRSRLLVRLFGESVTRRHMEIAA